MLSFRSRHSGNPCLQNIPDWVNKCLNTSVGQKSERHGQGSIPVPVSSIKRQMMVKKREERDFTNVQIGKENR